MEFTSQRNIFLYTITQFSSIRASKQVSMQQVYKQQKCLKKNNLSFSAVEIVILILQ